MIKNLEPREGYKNRHVDGMPDYGCDMYIVHKDTFEEMIFLCAWRPYDPNNYPVDDQPSKGYLGSCKVISGNLRGIGFNAWEQNDHEFIYYKIADPLNI